MKLICDLEEDMTGQILKGVTDALVCTEIDDLIVNMNNYKVVLFIELFMT